MEFAEGGELFDYVAKTGPFSSGVCRIFIKMLIKTVEYLSSVGISHRDLKLENILFDRNFNIKVADFGLSTLAEGHNGDGILYSRLGT
jgi:serine/threonine protein kinase